MSDFGQYAVSLLVIAAIAIADNFIVVEPTAHSITEDMMWVGATGQSASTRPMPETDLARQTTDPAGFWINSAFISTSDYQEFLTETGYIGSASMKPAIHVPDNSSASAPFAHRVFALQQDRQHRASVHDAARGGVALQYVSKVDALAYCNWQGLKLSSAHQNLLAARTRQQASSGSSKVSREAYSQTELQGFRCVKPVN